ncbi:MAG TPA: enoyl-CoA hydratase-related protein [Alphaproteobacteria bacterium]|nr:enoyl-CoA hydratase-related protein [Alphaproteobacteria bacterium]
MVETITIDTGTCTLLCEIRDRVAVITLNRPEIRNAMGDEITPFLRTQIQERGQDERVGAILLTGAGTAFCAGGNVKGMGANRSKEMTPEERISDLKWRQRHLTGALRAVRKPTIAALPGAAAGAGMALAMACDIRVAAQSAFLTTGYRHIALPGDYGIAWLLTRLVGTSRARQLMLTAERVAAVEALSIGLVNKVVPDTELQRAAFEMAKDIANGPSAAIEAMKDNLDDALIIDYETALDREAERLVPLSSHPNHHEAVQAFIDKRKPNFHKA